MSLSRITYTADGSTQSFGVPFVFRDREDVFVYVDGTVATFTWQNDSQLTVTLPVVTNGAEVQVIRRTKSTALDVTFIDGSGLPAGDLNAAVLQLYYLLQESLDDLGAPVDASLSATQAAASAAAAVVSAAAAAASAAVIDLTAPGPIGSVTASTGDFTTLGATTPGTGAFTSVDIGSTIAITGVLDEDTMSSDSAVKLATQQSIKAYADGLGASQANQETGTSSVKYVTPLVQHYHPSAAKAWISFNGTGAITITSSYNITSISDISTGLYTVTFATDFSSADYAFAGMSGGVGLSYLFVAHGYTPLAGSIVIQNVDNTTANADVSEVGMVFFGDQ